MRPHVKTCQPISGAPEDFRIGFELRVDFQSDYGFSTFLLCLSPYG
jgi:hypothetical protein